MTSPKNKKPSAEAPPAAPHAPGVLPPRLEEKEKYKAQVAKAQVKIATEKNLAAKLARQLALAAFTTKHDVAGAAPKSDFNPNSKWRAQKEDTEIRARAKPDTDGTMRFSPKDQGKLYQDRIANLDLIAMYEEMGLRLVNFKITSRPTIEFTTITTGWGLEVLRKEGYVRARVEQHLTQELNRPLFVLWEWLNQQDKRAATEGDKFDMAAFESAFEAERQKLVAIGVTALKGFTAEQIAKRKDERERAFDWRVESAGNVFKAVVAIGTAVGVAAASHGALAPLSVLGITRSSLVIFNEVMKNLMGEREAARLVAWQIAEINWEQQKLAGKNKSGSVDVLKQLASDFANTELTPTIKSATAILARHDVTVIDLKGRYDKLSRTLANTERFIKGISGAVAEAMKTAKVLPKGVDPKALTKELDATATKADASLKELKRRANALMERIAGAETTHATLAADLVKLKENNPNWAFTLSDALRFALNASLDFADPASSEGLLDQAFGFAGAAYSAISEVSPKLAAAVTAQFAKSQP